MFDAVYDLHRYCACADVNKAQGWTSKLILQPQTEIYQYNMYGQSLVGIGVLGSR